MKIIVTIPIYKNSLADFELISLNQGLKTLGNYHIKFICYKDLDLSSYKTILSNYENLKYSFEYFPKKYFKNIKGYNELLLSINFYKTISEWDYLLIYQLDAYIFKDDIIDWCNKGYSYIGAPWFKETEFGYSQSFNGVGNGGFSLRKIEDQIKVLKSTKKIKTLSILKEEVGWNNRNLKGKVSICTSLIKRLINKNNRFNYKFTTHYKYNEDYFFSNDAKNRFDFYTTPNETEALRFAFEINPEFLYKLNNEKLPTGCHAFQKYEPEFWKKFL